MSKRILSLLCAMAIVLGMVTVPAFAAETPAATNGAQEFDTLQEAVDAFDSGVITLNQDASAITVTKDVYLDLNGYDIAGVTVTGGTLFVSDAKTDDYTVADGDYGKVTGITGAVKANEGYLQITEGEEVSFHRVNLQLNAVVLRPEKTGIYYTSGFAADEMAAEAIETFGVSLSVAAVPNESNMKSSCISSEFFDFAAGANGNAANGTLLSGILKEDITDAQNNSRAKLSVHGRAYAKTESGILFGAPATYDLKTVVELIDAMWTKLSAAQQSGLVGMYRIYTSAMDSWNIPNLKAAGGDPDWMPEEDAFIVLPIPVAAENGTVSETVTVTEGAVSVTVPAGTALAEGASQLILKVTLKNTTDSGLTVGKGEVLLPLDVHVEGIAPENTQPLTISLGKQLPENLNLGNYEAYHVENGNANEMALIPVDAEFTAHNQFKYTLDGEVILHMASFSEITLLAEKAEWEGNRDYTWYNTTATTLYIRNADQLAGFGAIVGGMAKTADPEKAAKIEQDSFSGKTVVLLADIDLNDSEEDNNPDTIFYPIGYNSNDGKYEKTGVAVSTGFYAFCGTFDGNGNTISNIYQNTWEMKGDHNWYDATLQYFRDGMGLFGKVYGGTVKNLSVDNFKCDGEITTTGVIAAYADCGAKFENIAITNCNPRVYNIGNGGIVGCAGWYAKEVNSETPIVFRNITVDQTNKISALWGTYDASCGGILGQYYSNSGQTNSPKNGQIHFKNCHVAAIIDVNNDVCANYQYYWYRYSGMLMGTVRANKTDENGYTVADTSDIYAENCTYTYGSWNEYWYCELVKNSSASYTHDYQFGRLTNIAKISEITNDGGKTWLQEGNFALVSDDRKSVECYHIFKDSNGNLYRHFHDVADESNPNIYEDFDLNGDGELNDLKEDRQRYYLPFGQVLNGLGYGVKPTYELDGFTLVEDGTVISGPKFKVKADADLTYKPGQTIKLTDLVELNVNESKLSQSSLYAAVSPVDENGNVSASYSRNEEEWENNTITFSEDSKGAAKIVITDYFYCEPTVIILNEYVPESVDKFIPVENVTVNAGEAVKLGTLFTAADGVTIDSANITVNGATNYTADADNWTEATVVFTQAGTVNVTITDNNYCNTASTSVTVNPVAKFEKLFNNPNFMYRLGNDSTTKAKLSNLFAAKAGKTITGEVIVSVKSLSDSTTWENIKVSAASWGSSTLDFTGYTGVVEITIKDGDPCCELTKLIVEVVEAKNATAKMSATGNNVVLLNNITGGFTVSNGWAFYGNGFKTECYGDGSYGSASITVGNIYVQSGGVLDNLQVYCDIYPQSYMYTSEMSATNGRYPYVLSAIVLMGESKITNCYVRGARNNIFISGGSAVVENTVLECGSLSNLQIKGTSVDNVTLRNLTTIQYPVKATVGTEKTVMGFGVIVNDNDNTNNPTITLEGELRQYNWVDSTHASAVSNSYAQQAINGALGKTEYIHKTPDGKRDTVNLGIVCVNDDTSFKVVDKRDNKSSVPYLLREMTIGLKTGQVYSIQTSNVLSDGKNYDATQDGVIPYTANNVTVYVPQMRPDSNLGGQYLPNDEDAEEYCYYNGAQNTVEVMFVAGEEKVLDLTSMMKIAKYTGQDLGLIITCTNSSGENVDVSNGKLILSTKDIYTVTYTVTDSAFYDKDGNLLNKSVPYSREIFVNVSLKDLATPNARFELDLTVRAYSNKTSGDTYQFFPFLRGIKIIDYVGQEEYTRFDGKTDYNKVAKVGWKKNVSDGRNEGDHVIEAVLVDGGVITIDIQARATNGGSGYTPTIKTNSAGTEVYIVSSKASSANCSQWRVYSISFTGNNGVMIWESEENTTDILFGVDGERTQATKPGTNFNTSITYTVTYDANGGDCGQNVGYVTNKSVSTVILPTPFRSGYTFAGWFTASSEGTRVGGAGEEYKPTGNITLYAQWGKPCTVTYNANGGTCGKTTDRYTSNALTLPTPVRDGYWCTGWYTAPTGGNIVGKTGASYKPADDITLYAQWDVAYTVTLDANGGSCDTKTLTYMGDDLTLPIAAWDGYAFDGWNTKQDGTGTKLESPYKPTSNITVYAQWKAPVTVTYIDSAVGGSCSVQSATYIGVALTLPEVETETGYKFLGWYTAATGGTKFGDAGASYIPTANITLYARWEKISYNITYKNTNTKSVDGPKTATYGETVKVTVEYSKGQESEPIVTGGVTVTISGSGTKYTYTFVMPAEDVTMTITGSECVAAGTLITLADGTQKAVEDLTGDELLLVWNLETGRYEAAPIVFVDSDAETEYKVIRLVFADGTDVEIIYEHGFFDVTTGEYVYIDAYNAADYIGHSFIKQGVIAENTWETVELVDVIIETKLTTAYSPVTFSQLCYYVDGMLSMPGGIEGLFNIFEVDVDTMSYNAEKMAADIETYGLFTYEDFAGMIPEEAFYAFNGAWLKVAMGKGMLTWEDIEYMANRYVPLM